MRRQGVAATGCIAHGDSPSDIPLLRSMPYAVAVNASDALKRVATVVYDGDELRRACAAGRSLLGDDRATT